MSNLVLLGPRGTLRGASLLERIEAYSVAVPELGCHLWLGPLAGAGYPIIKVGSTLNGTRRNRLVHRIVYELTFGEIPNGYDVAHKCHQKLCVRPEHLKAVSHQQNCAERPTQAGGKGKGQTFRYDRGLPRWRE